MSLSNIAKTLGRSLAPVILSALAEALPPLIASGSRRLAKLIEPHNADGPASSSTVTIKVAPPPKAASSSDPASAQGSLPAT